MLLYPLLALTCVWAAWQDTKGNPDDRSIPPCAEATCRGKRIGHMLNMFQFCIPHGMKYRRVAGFEGDLHDRVTLSTHGEHSELIIFTANFTWGPVKTGPDNWPAPDSAHGETLSISQWRCSEGDGHDFKFQRAGRNWRLLTFPFGFAEYEDVPTSAAERFDKVLDSLCCKSFPPN